MNRIIGFFILLIFITSCSQYSGLTKRKHRKGFHISFNKNTNKRTGSSRIIEYESASKDTSISKNLEKAYIFLINGDTIEAIIEAINEDKIIYKKLNYQAGPSYFLSSAKIRNITTLSGDVIYENSMNNLRLITNEGDTIFAELISLSDNEIEYRKPDTTDGPIYIKGKESFIKMIDDNGKEIYANEITKSAEPKKNQVDLLEQVEVDIYSEHERKLTGSAVLAIISFSLLAIWFGLGVYYFTFYIGNMGVELLLGIFIGWGSLIASIITGVISFVNLGKAKELKGDIDYLEENKEMNK